jgi:hypothetical protein
MSNLIKINQIIEQTVEVLDKIYSTSITLAITGLCSVNKFFII